MKLKSAAAHWYRPGLGPVPVQWVFVRDDKGSRRDE